MQKNMLITKIFKNKGEKLTKEETYDRLVNLMSPESKYKEQKALGAIGSAISHGYIKECGKYYICTRDSQ